MKFRSVRATSCAGVFILAVILTSTLAPSDGISAESKACNFDDMSHLLDQDLAGLRMTEVNMNKQQISLEGGKASIYWENGSIKVIRSSFFAETGRMDIDYYFDNADGNVYLVDLTDSHYTKPVYQPGVKVASTVTSTFVVCDDREPNYPNSDSLTDVYRRSADVLAIIRKTLKER